MKIEHEGNLVRWHFAGRELIVPEPMPHECTVPGCPGNINRLKLEALSRLVDAAGRALELLNATRLFIDANPIGEYIVHYDEAECDGLCLADDCATAADSLSVILTKAKELK